MRKIYITALLVGLFCSSCSTTKNKTILPKSVKVKTKIQKMSKNEKFRILAEGDSWLAYPRLTNWPSHFTLKEFKKTGKGLLTVFVNWRQDNSNIVENLRSIDKNLRIKNISNSGKEAVDMFVGKAKHDLIERLEKDAKKDNPYDLILFSAGGNDIVGENDIPFIVKDYDPKNPQKKAKELIKHDRFKRRIDMTKNIYRDLIEISDEIYKKNNKPVPPIVTHTYDFIYPRSEGPNLGFLTPTKPMEPSCIDWLRNLRKPFGKGWVNRYLTEKKGYPKENYPNQVNEKGKIKRDIIIYLLSELNKALKELESEYKGRLKVVDTQGILEEKILLYKKWAEENKRKISDIQFIRAYWKDEIHPTNWGFMPITEKIYSEGIKPLVEEKRTSSKRNNKY